MTQPKPLTDLTDMLNVVGFKVSFLSDCFCQPINNTFQISKEGEQGLYYILEGIESEVQFVVNELEGRKEVN